MTNTICPEMNLLLAGDENPQLWRHVDGCKRCQQQLEAMEYPALPDKFRILLRPLSPEQERDVAAAQNVFNGSAPTTAWHPAALPRDFGAYQLLEQIGEPSGQGAVYRATHRKTGQTVALKTLRYDSPSSDQVERLNREAKSGRRIAHDNIVRVFDFGWHEFDCYLTMELLHGVSLGQCVKARGLLPADVVVALARQAVRGLCELKRFELVHRDIKPANLFLTAEGVVKILDLGLVVDFSHDATTLTKPNSAMGTADYMAPEQIRDAHRVDWRADFYALGATLYHFLAGHPPFAKYRTMPDKFRAHETELPRPLRQINPLVSPALAEIVARLLAKRPEDRFQTPDELQTALAALPIAEPDLQSIVTATLARPAAVPMPVVFNLHIDVDGRGGYVLAQSHSGAVPAGAAFYVEATFSRPAHVYLFGINAEGKVQWLHPQQALAATLVAPLPADHLELPDQTGAWTLDRGTGWQTFVLALNTEPISTEFLELELPNRLCRLPALHELGLGHAVHARSVRPIQCGVPSAARVNTTRQPRTPDLESRHNVVREALQDYVDCIELVSVPHSAR